MRPFLGSAGAGAGAARALSLGQAPAGSGAGAPYQPCPAEAAGTRAAAWAAMQGLLSSLFSSHAVAGTSLDGGASSAAPPAQGLRFSEKHQVAGSSAPTTSAPAEAPAPVAAAGPPPGPGPAARFVAQQRRQVLEARGAAANAGPAFEVRCPVRPASVSTTPAGSRAPPPGAHAGQPALEARGAGGRPPRASAEENSGAELQRRFSAGDKAENPAAKEPPTAGAEPAHAPPAPQPLSMLAVASHRGFQLAAQQGHREQCRRLQASRGLLGDVQRALQRGDAQAAVRLLKESKGERGGCAGVPGGCRVWRRVAITESMPAVPAGLPLCSQTWRWLPR